MAGLMVMMAVVLTLAAGTPWELMPQQVALASIYLLWIGFSGVAVLCSARRWLRFVNPAVLFFVCWALLVGITALLASTAWGLSQFLGLSGLPRERDFVARNVTIGVIVSALLLRLLWDRHSVQLRTRAGLEARFQALQARIRPHFLFNALNSVAALIAINPQRAEDLVQDLADVFRASLDNRAPLIPLTDEIETLQGYLRIEQTRMGDNRLTTTFHLPAEVMTAWVPPFSLQPLVENAVLHGVSRLRGPGEIVVTGKLVGKDRNTLVLTVENPVPPGPAAPSGGTGIALDNIRQRLSALFPGNNASLKTGLVAPPGAAPGTPAPGNPAPEPPSPPGRYVARLCLPRLDAITASGVTRAFLETI